jgi:hypothetical protein
LSLLRHFQRLTFYFNVITGAALTGYALYSGLYLLLYVAWTPLILYILFGILSAFRDSRIREAPFLPTRYYLDSKGVHVSTSQGASQLEWGHFSGWRVMIDCYVLALKAGSILAIPQASVPKHKQTQIDELLHTHIGRPGG